MPDVSKIDQIVDASAYVASLISGIKAVYGCGSGATFGTPAAAINAFAGDPREPFVHFSELPGAPSVRHLSRTVTEVTWSIPMYLFLAAGDPDSARVEAAPFYAKYLTTFSQHTQLEGTVNSALITGFALAKVLEGTWYAIQMTLTAIERLDLNNAP